MRVICSQCERDYAVGTLGRCPVCGGILRPDYPDDAVATLATIKPGRGIDRYRATLPVSIPIPYLGEGDTPLLLSRRIAPGFGAHNVYFKNEGLNPTGAFKDRAGSMVAALALQAGAPGVITASSGNASSAISAYCAVAGIKVVILLEPGNPAGKLRQTLATGARVLLVEGIFSRGPDALADTLFAVAERSGYYCGFVWGPVNPYILEGIKTISYEVTAQLGGAPDVVVCPVGGGDMFAAQWRGYKELKRAGVIDKLPRMIGVQSHNAPPLAEAYAQHADHVATLSYARSRISGINVAFTGDHALDAIRESGGMAVTVNDDVVLDMQRRMAVEEGIWVEPAGATAITALADLVQHGEISPDQRVVCVISGGGFKDSHLAEDQVERLGQQATTPMDVDAISAALQQA